jgi:hypothetical protein
MILQFVIALVVGFVPTFLFWAYIHELFHVVAAEHLVGVKSWKIGVLPHRYKGSWRWAYNSKVLDRPLRSGEQGWISLAPRAANLFPVVGFPLFSYFPDWMWAAWFVVFGGGLLDLWVGSWGSSLHSDLQKAAADFGVSPWLIRVPGWLALAGSVIAAVVVTSLNWG